MTWPVDELVDQVLEYLPLLGVVLWTNSGGPRKEQIALLSVPDLHGTAMPYFWSLLVASEAGWRQAEEFEAEVSLSHEEQAEQLTATQEDPTEEEELGPSPPGRPRLEDPRRCGPGLVTFVRNFIMTKGQGIIKDHHRLRPTGEVYGAPLRSIVAAAREHGYDVSASGIRNLLAKTRKDSRGTPRGLVDARPATKYAGERIWHPRAAWSATLAN